MSNKKYWGDKPYNSLNHYIKETYGRKLYKLSLNGGMTCPNRDGTLDNRGCIFCSKGGSGDFTPASELSISKQIQEAKNLVKKKFEEDPTQASYIAYFQAFTNTYAPIEHLRSIYMEAIQNPSVAILSIATRPDCLGDDVLALLKELNEIKPVWIELGLQTIHISSEILIRRGYPLSVYDQAVEKLNELKIPIIVHIILGLPDETTEDMLDSIRYISEQNIFGVKLQLLHVLKDTDLAKLNPSIMTMDEYIHIIKDIIEILPQNIVIHRITGDGPKELLIGPLWSGNKKHVLNSIHKYFKISDTWQGKHYNTKGVISCNLIP